MIYYLCSIGVLRQIPRCQERKGSSNEQNPPPHSEAALLAEIKRMIDSSRHKVLVAVNTEIALLYWNVGKYIHHFLLSNGRAEYGKQIVAELSPRLVAEYGKGWGKEHLWHCIRSAETFTEEQMIYAVRR